MKSGLPLAAANARLRGKPGRPRTRPASEKAAPIAMPATGTITPRLVHVADAGRYVAVSPWTIRDLIASGTLRPVRLPGAGGRDLRRVLLDLRDLDALVERSKDAEPTA